MKKKVKKKIIKFFVITHQWSGFILSLMFLIWFLSGFVLMYKDFPYIQRAEIIEKSTAIPLQAVAHADSLPIGGFESIHTAKLIAQFQRPLWRIIDREGRPSAYFADTGEELRLSNEEDAIKVVADFESMPVKALSVQFDDWLDQWTPRTRFIPYLPWYKVKVDDGKGTVYYVSSVNGEIVQKLNTADKVWAWLGAIPHWIYFKDLRITTQRWRDVVVALSIAGVLMSITGLVLGFIRYKRNRGLAFSPYKKFWFKWHHYIGFVFGLFVFTWILSGLFSMNPWSWSPPANLTKDEAGNWQGHLPFESGIIPNEVFDAISTANNYGAVKELSFASFDSKLLMKLEFSDRKPVSFLLSPGKTEGYEKFSMPYLINRSEAAIGARVIKATEITEYDTYYVDKWNKRPLPVYKFDFDDESKTTLYIEPHTAQVMYKYIPITRWNRWLYHGMHSLDIPILLKYRPLWDVLVIILMIGGTAISITGVVLTWKWLLKKTRKPKLSQKKLVRNA
jgi:uncharacterized iron-regulated membrane protein